MPSAELTGRLTDGLRGLGSLDGTNYQFSCLDRMPELEKTALLERRIINRGISKKQAPAALILSEDERISVSLNGDDHIRCGAWSGPWGLLSSGRPD